MNAARRAGVLAVVALVAAGCSAPELKPGVTYQATVITAGDGGIPAARGPELRVESVRVQDVREIGSDGTVLTLAVRKTEHERATFEVTFPDKTSEIVRVKTGETKDVLPKGQKVGVRIEVRECR